MSARNSKRKRRRGNRRPTRAAAQASAEGGAEASVAEEAAKETAALARPAARPRARRVSDPDQRPPAPWGNFPLAELTILGGIVALAYGIFGGSTTAIGVGVVLAGLGGLEVAIREHFAGYRSHTSLLAGTVFVVTVGCVYYLGKQVLAVGLGAGAVTFALSFVLLRRAFQRASGGFSYRIGGFRG